MPRGRKPKPKPTTKETEINIPAGLPEDYNVRIAMAKLVQMEEDAERARLANRKAKFDLDRLSCNICYKMVAEQTFEASLKDLLTVIKNAPDQISTAIKRAFELQPAQVVQLNTILQSQFDIIMTSLSDVEIDIPTTEDTDANIGHNNAAAKRKVRGC